MATSKTNAARKPVKPARPAAKKAAPRTLAAKKPAAKAAARPATKTAPKKAAPKKAAPGKAASGKAAAKTAPKKAPVKGPAKAVAKRPAAKATATKPAAKKAKKASPQKAPLRKGPPPKVTAGKPAAGKAPPKKAAPRAKQVESKLPHIEAKTLGLIVGKLQEMRDESLHIVNHNLQSDLTPREVSSDVGDDLDQASNERDREFNLIMHQRHLRRLRQIRDAFDRIEDGSYGLCEGTDEPINPRRLLIMPLARYSLEFQEQQEKMMGRSVDSDTMYESDDSFSAED